MFILFFIQLICSTFDCDWYSSYNSFVTLIIVLIRHNTLIIGSCYPNRRQLFICGLTFYNKFLNY